MLAKRDLCSSDSWGWHPPAGCNQLAYPLVRFQLKEHPVFRIMPPAGYHVLKPMRLQLPDILCLNLHTVFRKHVIIALITSATQRHIFSSSTQWHQSMGEHRHGVWSFQQSWGSGLLSNSWTQPCASIIKLLPSQSQLLMMECMHNSN